MTIRKPAVAGTFYPSDPAALRRMVETLLGQAISTRSKTVKALIAPHAGYVYSGPVAASAFVTLRHRPQHTGRIVLVGPAHTVSLSGLAVPKTAAFRTPLGDVPINRAAVRSVAALPDVACADGPHRREHALEVELPFLQQVLPNFDIVPIVVGEVDPGHLAHVLDRLWGGPETVVVVSSDLSHYLPYDEARILDQRTSEAIVQLRPDDIGVEQACGRRPIQALLKVVRARGLEAERLDLRSSGDTTGHRDRVVGYGAFAFG